MVDAEALEDESYYAVHFLGLELPHMRPCAMDIRKQYVLLSALCTGRLQDLHLLLRERTQQKHTPGL
jgi:hypothetical protein